MVSLITDPLSYSKKFENLNIEDVVKYCEQQSVLAVDTETEGLDFTCMKMTMFQIGDENHQFIIDTRVISIEPLRGILESKEILKLFHNAKFDYKFIKRWADIECEHVYDTYLAEQVINCGKEIKYGLAQVCERYLGVVLNKEVRSSFIGLTTKAYTNEQIEYGAKDVEYLCKIRNKQLPLIEKYQLENVVQLENDAVLGFADIEYNGLDIDKEAWTSLSEVCVTDAITLKESLDALIIDDERLQKFVPKYVQGDLFTEKEEIRKLDIMWTSPTQVLKVFKTLIPELDNVNGKEMYKYRRGNPLIDTYVRYKEKMKIATSYGPAFFKYIASDDKIHTGFRQILDTGRVSSSKPNMQQIPASNDFRNCFTAPTDWCFVSSDYSSQELNVIAFGSKDPVWIECLEKGQDLHSVCADLVYGQEWKDAAEGDCRYYAYANIGRGTDRAKLKCSCPEHKKLRTNVKTINFGLAYGMGPNKLADTLNIGIPEAKELIEKYFKSFPAIGGFLDKLASFGKKYGYIKTFPPYNRRRWFSNWYPNIWNNKSELRELGSIERASKNTPIQGASADMTKLALHYIRMYIKEHKVPVKMVMTVHDQIDTICAIDYAQQWVTKMTELMEKAALVVVTNGLLKADTNISKSWEK